MNVDGKPFLDKLSGIDELTVMDYRTDPDQIQQFAEPFLDWGNQHGKSVFIALEAGDLPEQTQAVYHPASPGDLWHVTVTGQHVLLLLKEPAVNPAGDSFLFAYQTNLNHNRLTFHDHIRALIELIPDLQKRLGVWNSYQGLSLHQYLEISRQP
jgi:hypothetical protein